MGIELVQKRGASEVLVELCVVVGAPILCYDEQNWMPTDPVYLIVGTLEAAIQRMKPTI